MAQQHFYSCVPARMSMFLRTDGFDTFEAAQELTEEWIEKELSPVLSYRIGKNEPDGIRLGTLPDTYFCFFTKNDRRLVESCLSYIAKDYTGERPSFLLHSLICSEEEKKALMTGEDVCVIDPSAFVSDIAPFRIDTPNANPNSAYPDKELIPKAAPDPTVLTESYPPQVIRRLIFAMIATACGKGKPIYISLPCETKELSARAVELLNALYPLFPSTLRSALSFVTYQSEYTKFPQFAIHFLPENAMKIPAERGYLFNMTTALADGIPDALYRDNEQLADFFFSLIGNAEMRKEFLAFYEQALAKDKALSELSLKNLTCIVYIYRYFSGRYEERKILPNDDAVYDLICRYEKHRTALTAEQRAAVICVTERYLKTHTLIPKTTFGKICKLYPTEPPQAKVALMSIILEMIHTDIMRDKLFRFIEKIYIDEPIEQRSRICESLIRVFYGGFLQNQILRLIAENFRSETERTRDTVVEKLILSIRTAAIQDAILDFFHCFYADLTDRQKSSFYVMIYEMLPAGDALAVKLAAFLDRHLPEESEQFRLAAEEKLLELVAFEQRKKTHRMLPVLTAKEGFCRKLVLAAAVGKWRDGHIFRELMDRELSGNIGEQISRLVSLWKEHPYLSDDAVEKLLTVASEHIESDTKATLFDYLNAEKKLKEELIGKYNAVCDDFCARLIENHIHPAVCAHIEDAFRSELCDDGPEQLLAYVAENDYPSRSENAIIYKAFTEALAYAEQGKRAEEVIEQLVLSSAHCRKPERIFTAAADRILPLLSAGNVYTIALGAALKILNGYRKSKELLFSAAFSFILDTIAEKDQKDHAQKPQKPDKTAASLDNEKAFLILADACVALRRCDVGEDLHTLLVSEGEGEDAFFALLNGIWPQLLPAEQMLLKDEISKINDAPFVALMEKVIEQVEKANKKGFFAKLFGK